MGQKVPAARVTAKNVPVAAASIQCLVVVTPFGLTPSDEHSKAFKVLFPAVPQIGSALDMRDHIGAIVGVTGVNFKPNDPEVTILTNVLSLDEPTPDEDVYVQKGEGGAVELVAGDGLNSHGADLGGDGISDGGLGAAEYRAAHEGVADFPDQ